MPKMISSLWGAAIAALVLAGSAAGAGGGPSVYLTVDEALELAFPEAKVERTTVFLQPKQLERATKRAGEEVSSRIAYPYVARNAKGQLIGTAYFDTHRVRSKKETVMVVIDSAGRIARVEVLAFAEPEDYLPRAKWYSLFVGRTLDEELRVKRGIPNVTGATLTVRASTNSCRRILALHEAISQPGTSNGVVASR